MTNPLLPLAVQLRSGDVVLAAALFLAVTWALWALLRAAGKLPRRRWIDGYGNFAWQLGALLGLEQAYEFTRAQIPQKTDVALLHAYRLLDFEWRHGFFVESRVERFFLHFRTLMDAIDLFYVLGHALVTIAVLVWIYACRRRYYPFVRNLFILTTAIALVAFYLYPTAPPRMLGNYGFVDPMQLHQLVSAGGAQPDSYTYNPYAAMPSLHVGYALVVGLGLVLAERRLWIKLMAALYPLAMAAAVVISGNHWLLDVAGAVATVSIAALVLVGLGRLQTWLLPMVPSSVTLLRLIWPAEKAIERT